MTSVHALSQDYYSLPNCKPSAGAKMQHENLGELLSGDRIESSPYYLLMKTDMYCEQLCVANLGRAEQKNSQPDRFVKAIRKEFHNNWIVDNLPAASKSENDAHIITRYWQGFPIGYIDDQKAYVNNHVNIEITYHPAESEPGKFRVVRFMVEPFSIEHKFDEINPDGSDSFLAKIAKIQNPIAACNPSLAGNSAHKHTDYDQIKAADHYPQVASGKVLFTYDVIWIEDLNLKWASRWDIYLSMDE
jgi:transmembrane 9 superfamily protein 2/4